MVHGRKTMTIAWMGSMAILVALVGCNETTDPVSPEPEREISAHINEAMTLHGEGVYEVTRGVDVNADLTIEPGATLEFAQNAYLQVREGAIIAVGTEDEPILFTGTEKHPGWWKGVHFHSSDDMNNRLEHVIIEYGGREAHSGHLEPANLVIADGVYTARVTVVNSTLRHSGGYGVHVHTRGILDKWESNTYTANAEGPLSLYAHQLHDLDSNSSFTGNEIDFVRVGDRDIESGDVAYWKALDAPYAFRGRTDVYGSLTVEEGVTIAFEQEAALRVGSDGEIIADGTVDDPIRFTATQEQPGWWAGVHVRSESLNNLFRNVIIEYGGRQGTALEANLSVGESVYSGRAQIIDCVLRKSAGHGIRVDRHGTVNEDIGTANTFEDNASGAYDIAD